MISILDIPGVVEAEMVERHAYNLLHQIIISRVIVELFEDFYQHQTEEEVDGQLINKPTNLVLHTTPL